MIVASSSTNTCSHPCQEVGSRGCPHLASQRWPSRSPPSADAAVAQTTMARRSRRTRPKRQPPRNGYASGLEARPVPEHQGRADETKIWLTTGEQLKPVERDLSGDEAKPLPRRSSRARPGRRKAAISTRLRRFPPARGRGRRGRGRRHGHVKVTKDFLEGPRPTRPRDAAQEEALDARLSQVTYTLTQFDDVDSAKVVAGGVSTGPPRDRADFAKPQGGPPPIKKPKGSTAPAPLRSSRGCRTSATCRRVPSTG